MFTSAVAEVGASFVVVFIVISLELKQLCVSVVVALDPERSCLGYQDAVSRWPLWSGVPDLGFLWRWNGGIVCG